MTCGMGDRPGSAPSDAGREPTYSTHPRSELHSCASSPNATGDFIRNGCWPSSASIRCRPAWIRASIGRQRAASSTRPHGPPTRRLSSGSWSDSGYRVARERRAIGAVEHPHQPARPVETSNRHAGRPFRRPHSLPLVSPPDRFLKTWQSRSP